MAERHPKPLVLALDSSYSDHRVERAAIEAAGGELVVCSPPLATEDEILGSPLLAVADVLLVELAQITARVLAGAVHCSAVIRYGTGLDNVDLQAATELGVQVRGVPGYAADSVSDHTIALLLALARRLPEAAALVKAGGWRDSVAPERPVGLRGRTLGLVGAGAIARAVALRARGFGLECVAFDPFVNDETMRENGIRAVAFDELCKASDFISLHAPLTTETKHLFSRNTFESMKSSAFLINTSRGGLVDESALLWALDANELRGAAIDVTETEPPVRRSKLRDHPRVLITPHIAFWSDWSELALRAAVAQHAVEAISVNTRRRVPSVSAPDSTGFEDGEWAQLSPSESPR